MKALVCLSHGPLDQLDIREIDRPILRPGCLRVGVTVAAVNPPDILMPQGLYQVRPTLPFVPGIEAAGIVTEVASDVEGFSPGDRVMTYAGQGCFAEEVIVPADRIFHVPDGMTDEAAAGFVLAYGTVFHALIDCGELSDGLTVVVLGAAGGLGLAAIQVAKALGARVVAVASTPEKRAHCQAAGADDVLETDPPSLRDRIRAATQGRGPDVVLDVVGGDLTEPALRAIAPFGRFVIAGYASGTIPNIKANLVLLKQAKVVGASFRLLIEQRPQQAGTTIARLIELWRGGLLQPVVGHSFTFPAVLDALREVQDGRATGRVTVSLRS